MKEKNDGNIDNVQYASLLYDFYGGLLSAGQAEVMDLYHEDNLSLSEIAEELGQSRQAVHYTLKRAERSLEEHEEKLGLVASYRVNREKADRAAEIGRKLLADETISKEAKEDIGHILRIIEELAE